MKAKDLLSELGGLLDATSSMNDYNSSGYEDSIPAELEEPDPIFEFNHQGELSLSLIKALKYLKKMVDAVIPEAYQKFPVIQDKIELDMELLGQLFYQQETNNVMLKAAMDVVSKGDTQPRMFEVYTKLMTASSDLSKQVTELLNQFRKYYIDTYLDLQHKEEEDAINLNPQLLNGPTLHAIVNKVEEESIENRYVSTKDLTDELHAAKKERFKKKLLEAQNKNAEE